MVKRCHRADGSLYQKDNYKNGEPHGVSKSYDEEGNLTTEGEWIDGELH